MKNLGLCSVTFRNKNVEEIIALAVENELNCIEWGGDIHVNPQDVDNALKVGELTRRSGLKTLSYGSYYKFSGDFECVLSTAEALGANIIRIWAGEKDGELFTASEYALLVERVKECARIAAKRGHTLAFEHHFGTYCNTADNALKLLGDVNEPNVKTYWQPAYWRKQNQFDEDVRAIELLKSYIVGVHVYEWADGKRFPLRDGTEKWQKFVSLIGDNNYYLEFVCNDCCEAFECDVNTLKNL